MKQTMTAPNVGRDAGFNGLVTALESMDALNRWARSTGCHRPRKAIYWLKSKYAIRDAIMAGMTSRMRYVEARVKCNRCRAGIYFDWDGQSRGQCYHCNGRGEASLKFVETTLADRFVWHTPLDYSSWHGWPMRDLTPVPAEGWLPGREGVELSLEEAARHLNVVENHWQQWREEKPYSLDYDEYDSTRYYNFNYSLELPREEGPCALCGSADEEEANNCSVTFPPGLELTRRVCRVCKHLPNLWEKLYDVPLPTLAPEVRDWRERHLIQFGEIWKQRKWVFDKEWQATRARPLNTQDQRPTAP